LKKRFLHQTLIYNLSSYIAWIVIAIKILRPYMNSHSTYPYCILHYNRPVDRQTDIRQYIIRVSIGTTRRHETGLARTSKNSRENFKAS